MCSVEDGDHIQVIHGDFQCQVIVPVRTLPVGLNGIRITHFFGTGPFSFHIGSTYKFGSKKKLFLTGSFNICFQNSDAVVPVHLIGIEYNGSHFNGWQIQSQDARTVQGLVQLALEKIAIHPISLICAGRTDTGVSALGQVFAMDLEVDTREVGRRLNSRLPPDIRVWAECTAGPDFSPRRNAINRTYAYFLHSPELDVELARKALGVLCGEHDFKNLCKNERGRPTKARIDIAEINGASPIYRLRFNAPWFLWQQVRRMASAVNMVGTDCLTLECLCDMLQPEYAGQSVPPSRPEGLFLDTIGYKGLKWEVDTRTVDYMKEKMKGMVAESSVSVAVIEGFLSGLPNGI